MLTAIAKFLSGWETVYTLLAANWFTANRDIGHPKRLTHLQRQFGETCVRANRDTSYPPDMIAY